MPLALLRLSLRCCFDPPGRSRGRRGRWSLLLSLGLLSGGLLACRPGPAPGHRTPPAISDEVLRQQQQQLAARQCQQRRQQLLEELAELRRAEASLARERAAAAPSLPAPPVWDEASEQRYSPVDQELDRQRYEQELAAWQRRREERAVVRAGQRQRLAAAQQRLDHQAQLLQQRYPGLFTGPESIEVRPQDLQRLSRCPDSPA